MRTEEQQRFDGTANRPKVEARRKRDVEDEDCGNHSPLSDSCVIRDAMSRSGVDAIHVQLTCSDIVRMRRGKPYRPPPSALTA